MKVRWMMLGALCTACPPPAMNPTPDPYPGAAGSEAPPVASAPIPPKAEATAATKPPRDAAPPPLTSPNPVAKGSDASVAPALPKGPFKTDKAALKAIGVRAQDCADRNAIALPPTKPLWVRMMLSLAPDGKVVDLRLSGTSGLTTLDECATSAARAVQFPPRESAIWLEAPIGFSANTQD